MRLLMLTTPAVALMACESPIPDIPPQDQNADTGRSHSFVVDGGAGAHSATLTLNGESSPMREIERQFFSARREADSASGRIEIIYDGDGATAYCSIRNIRPGDDEPHSYVVERLECREE